jgi:hypothetical protein
MAQITRYDIRFPQWSLNMSKRGPKKGEAPAPKPGTAIINQDGRITAKRHLDKWTDHALAAADVGKGLSPLVYLPPMLKGKRPTVVEGGALLNPPTVKENIVRIHDELDPIGMLMAAAAGLPLVAWIVTRDGQVEEISEVLPLKDRIKIAQWLGDRVMPRLRAGIVEHRKPPKDEDEDGWEAKLQAAAANADGRSRKA